MTVDDKLLDISHYDHDTFDPGCFAAEGVRRVIIAATFQPAVTRAQIEGCRAAGIEVIGLYSLIYFGDSPHYVNRDSDLGIALCKEYGIPWLWLDCEVDAAGIVQVSPSNPEQRRRQIDHVVRKVKMADIRPGIYTGGWWWPSRTENWVGCAGLPLWHSAYGAGGGPRPPVMTVNYGGWRAVTIHQYTSRLPLCGRPTRDHNYLLRPERLGLEQEEDEMTPEERQLLNRLAADVTSLQGSVASLNDALILQRFPLAAWALSEQDIAKVREATKLLREKGLM